MKTIAPYNYDAINNILNASNAFLKKASQLGTAEYRTLIQLRNENPGMKIVKIEKKASNRPVSITFAKMEDFIAQCRDSKVRLEDFKKVKALSKIQASPYAYVKTWFLTNYANYSEQPEFDAEGFVIVKTKKQMDAEANAQKAEVEAEALVAEKALEQTT